MFVDGNIGIQRTGISHNDEYSQVVLHIQNGQSLLWAALYDGDYTAETIPEYHPKGYMVEALNCGALHVTTTATIQADNWVKDGTLYVNQIRITGIRNSDMPHITPAYNWDADNPYMQKEAWDKVSYAISLDGAIDFVSLEDLPTTNIPIQIEVIR